MGEPPSESCTGGVDTYNCWQICLCNDGTGECNTDSISREQLPAYRLGHRLARFFRPAWHGIGESLVSVTILSQRENPAVHGVDETLRVSFAHQNAKRSGDGRESRKLGAANYQTVAGWNPNG